MINNYFSDYKSNSNSDNKLRLYRGKGNNKRLYVSKYLIGKYLILSDNKSDNKSLIVDISDKKSGGLRVNNQKFISLNKMSDNVYNKLLNKSLVYSDKINKLINK